MATKKDLVEAYSFSRRRLVTAFVSGAPGGREVEPTRPGRTLIGGVALAVLLVAGALVLGIIKSPTNVDWDTEALVSEKETGADYVNLTPPDGGDPVLRPVINITSAMLLLGADVTSTPVPQDEIASRDRGEPIGILQAPATPPRVPNLIPTGWTACVGTVGGDDQGIELSVSDEQLVTPTPDTSFVVSTPDGRVFLVAESPLGWDRPEPRAYAYPVDDKIAAALLPLVADITIDRVVRVPADWITLFPAGGRLGLSTFGLSKGDIGGRSTLTGEGTVPAEARTGDVLDGDGVSYLLLADRALKLDDFSSAVYAGSFPGGGAATRWPIGGPPPGDTGDAASLAGANWPSRTTAEQPSGSLCAVLDAAEAVDPGVHLARADTGSAAAPDGIPIEQIDRSIKSGSGAVVLAGDWDSSGDSSLTLVDDRGLAYRIDGDEARDNLGYGTVPDRVVPSSWLQLFEKGVVLSIDAARCPPTSRDTGTTCADQ